MRKKYSSRYFVLILLSLFLYSAQFSHTQITNAYYDDGINDSSVHIDTVESNTSDGRSLAIDVGQYSSIARTTGNMPVISYYDNTHGDLKLAICYDATCTNPTIMTLDSVGFVGLHSSIAMTTDNIPVVSYYDGTNQDLKIAICNNSACTSPIIKALDTEGAVGIETSIDLTSTNSPVISYYDSTNTNLKLVICSDRTCTSSRIVTVDGAASSVGRFSSVALTTSNVPVISYYAAGSHNRIKIAFCGNPSCTAITYKSPVAQGAGGDYTSIALTSTNIPVVSYRVNNTNLQISVCGDSACNSVTNKILDSTSNVGVYTSVALTSANIPIVSYRAAGTGDLKLATCGNAACTTASNKNIAVTGDVGSFTSIALSSTNVPWISYYDATNKNLRLYRESSPITIVDDGQPNTFSKTSPMHNRTNVGTSVELSWAPSAYASSYEYCFATSSGTCTNWVDTGMSTTVSESNLDYETTYYWQVRAKNAVGSTLANRSDFWQFTTQAYESTPPEQFSKIAPADDSISTLTSVMLEWDASLLATDYEYCWATSVEDCTNWTSANTETSVTLSETDLVCGTTYYWQVLATNADGEAYADEDVYWTFSIECPPGAFEKSAPASDTIVKQNRLTLSWTTSTYVEGYEYCVAVADEPCDEWINVGDETSVNVTDLVQNTTYHWQVRAINADGVTYADEDAYWTFSIEYPPGAFNKSDPTNGGLVKQNYTNLSWTTSDHAESYEYCVAVSDETCDEWVNVGDETSVNITGLVHNTTYYWQVRARNSFGTMLADVPDEYCIEFDNDVCIEWMEDSIGSINRFDVMLPPATFARLAPKNNATIRTTRATLSWEASARAVRYEYCISTTNKCTKWINAGSKLSVTVTGLVSNKTYQWQVRAVNSSGKIDALPKQVWKFKVAR